MELSSNAAEDWFSTSDPVLSGALLFLFFLLLSCDSIRNGLVSQQFICHVTGACRYLVELLHKFLLFLLRELKLMFVGVLEERGHKLPLFVELYFE